jgi:hypothetical protein
MKQYIRKFVVTAAMVLAVSGVAQAKDNGDDGKPCSDPTLHGLYVFNPSGYDIVGGVAQPKAILELISFNGDGTLTVPAATASINGTIFRSPPNGPGTYTVGPDCTGSLACGPPGPTFPFDLFVAFKGSAVYMIQTGPGSPVMQGTAERVSR